MKKILLLMSFMLVLVTLKAQVYTLTDESNAVVSSGDEITVEFTDANTVINTHFTLKSPTDQFYRLQRTSSEKPADAVFSVCLLPGDCYAPHLTLFPPVGSEPDPYFDNHAADLKLTYDPKGIEENASAVYKVYQDNDSDGENDDPNNDIIFTIKYVYKSTGAGVDELKMNENLLAYPNPANSNVNILFNTSEKAEIVLYNIVGEKVRSYTVTPESHKINIETSNLPVGTYFYSMVSDTKITATKRLVIKR